MNTEVQPAGLQVFTKTMGCLGSETKIKPEAREEDWKLQF